MPFCVGVGSALLLALALWLFSPTEPPGPALPPQVAAPQPAATPPSLQGTAQRVERQGQAQSPILLVRDADRRTGLGGAQVLMLPNEQSHAIAASRTARTIADQEGVLRLPPEEWADDRPWVFSASGYRPTTVRPSALLARVVDGAVAVDLSRGLHVSGRVVTPWGEPVPNAEVVGYGRYGADFDGTEAYLAPGLTTAGEVFRGRSDESGAFAITGIASFPIRIQASKHGFAWKADPEQEVLFVDGETDQVRLVLRPLLAAGLRVVDGRTKEVVRDFYVQLKSSAGPVTGWAEASYLRPGRVPALGFPYREGEWWLTGSYDDSASGDSDSAQVVAVITAPGYQAVSDVHLVLRPLDPSAPPPPSVVSMTPTEPTDRGLLRVHVANAVSGTRLPWANVRIEKLKSDTASGTPQLDWTFRVDLDERGRATRALSLPIGLYRVQLGKGTGWATWQPANDEPWIEVSLSSVEREVSLSFRAALLRITATLKSGGPIGMFNLMVHDVTEPPPGVRRAVAPMVAHLSEESERWWLEYGHPYQSHLRMEPGAFDLLLPRGRYNIKVTKLGFSEPQPVVIDLAEGQVAPVSFEFEPAPEAGGR